MCTKIAKRIWWITDIIEYNDRTPRRINILRAFRDRGVESVNETEAEDRETKEKTDRGVKK